MVGFMVVNAKVDLNVKKRQADSTANHDTVVTYYHTTETVSYETCDAYYSQSDDGVFSREFQSIGSGITAVSTRGNEVWVLKEDNDFTVRAAPDFSIYRFKNGKWQRIPGGAVSVGASPDGYTWVASHGDGVHNRPIHVFNPVKFAPGVPHMTFWDVNPGVTWTVQPASKDEAVAANWDGIHWYKNGAWSKIGGPPVSWASIGQEHIIWGVGQPGNLGEYANSHWVQPQYQVNALTVDVYNRDRIIYTDKSNQLFKFNPSDRTWTLIPGVVAFRASINARYVITLDRHLGSLQVHRI